MTEGEMVGWHHQLSGHEFEYWLFIALGGLSSSCGQQGLLFVAMCGLLTMVVGLLLRSTRSRRMGFSSCSAPACHCRSWALEQGLSSCGVPA